MTLTFFFFFFFSRFDCEEMGVDPSPVFPLPPSPKTFHFRTITNADKKREREKLRGADQNLYHPGRWGHDGVTHCNQTPKGGRGREWINNNNKKKKKERKENPPSNNRMRTMSQQQQSTTMCVWVFFIFFPKLFRFHCTDFFSHSSFVFWVYIYIFFLHFSFQFDLMLWKKKIIIINPNDVDR